MKRGIVFIFLLLFVSSFIFSCSSSSENKSSGGIRHIYEESEKNAAEVTGIKIAGNYIELAKENGGGDTFALQYRCVRSTKQCKE